MEVDTTNRLLLPRSLMDYAGIDRDIVLLAYGNRIEVWSPECISPHDEKKKLAMYRSCEK